MRRLASVLLWSAISAAFIGPGTVTTAAAAGCSYRLSLLWALAFSTIACLALQEAAARLTIAGRLSLGPAIRASLGGGAAWAAVGAVVLGCAAYQAGNLMGAAAAAGLALDSDARVASLIAALIAAVLLYSAEPARVARLLAIIVAAMGLAFLASAFLVGPSPADLVRAVAVPRVPKGSTALVLGLVGTTVVPYNLFLGSGLARGQRLSETRLGLAVAIPLGGLISAAVLVTGTAVAGRFSFEALSDALAGELGGWAAGLLALGLFAAGLSSAITAPLAAAVAVRALASGDGDQAWSPRSWRYRAVWGVVLGVGLGFSLAGVRPIPAIILAQALGGIVLPLVAVFLLLVTNDRRIVGRAANGVLANVFVGASAFVSLVLGSAGLLRAGAAALSRPAPSEATVLALALVAAAVLAWPVIGQIRRRRRISEDEC